MKAILILALFAAVGTCLPAPETHNYEKGEHKHNNPYGYVKSNPVPVGARPVRAAPATLKSKDDLDAAGFFYGGLYGYGYGYGYPYGYSRLGYGYGYGYPYGYGYGIYGG